MNNKQHSTFFIFITNNCNLKCLGCMQSCDRIKEPYYMTLQEFEECLKNLSSNHFTIHGYPISTIHLTGGDPLTHPQWQNFCIMINKYFPKVTIAISTNGLFLNKISDNDLIQLNQQCQYNLEFQFSIYADENLIKMYKKNMKRLEALNIHYTFGGSSHFFFSKQDDCNSKKTNDYINKYITQNCYTRLLNQNHVIFYKGKIYSCWVDINMLQRKEQSQKIDDGLLLTPNSQLELMQNKKHYYCTFCEKCNGSGGREFILWQHHNKNADIIFNSNLKDLFINNYPIYYDLQHNCKKQLNIIQDELFLKFLPTEQKEYIETRFLKGLGDIFIPFSTKISINKLHSFLNNIKNIELYNLYFISINANSEIEQIMYSNFLPFCPEDKLNNYFLKANTLYNGYKTFLNNSYLSNKFIIDLEQNNFELLPLQD